MRQRRPVSDDLEARRAQQQCVPMGKRVVLDRAVGA
jgi:hypothetical protein